MRNRPNPTADLPPAVREMAEWLLYMSDPVSLIAARAVSGGCTNRAAIGMLSPVNEVFIKWNVAAPPTMFEAEAAGLSVLAQANTLRVPAPIAYTAPEDVAAGKIAVLVTESLTMPRGSSVFGRPGRVRPLQWKPAAWRAEELGRGLAALHQATADQFGFPSGNFIGPTPQGNASMESWPDFFRERRLAPMLRRLEDSSMLSQEAEPIFYRLLERVEGLIETGDPPSLVHGDLWSGNVVDDLDGNPSLIDPAAHYAHREVDLAMMRLFGGFEQRVFDAYLEAWPLADPEGWPMRRDIYNLYHLLNHALLFGGDYLSRALGIARRYA